MNWYEYALIIWIIIITMWIINLFLIIKIKEKHILEMQNIDIKNLKEIIEMYNNHYKNMFAIYENYYEEKFKINKEKIDEIIEYLKNENKE